MPRLPVALLNAIVLPLFASAWLAAAQQPVAPSSDPARAPSVSQALPALQQHQPEAALRILKQVLADDPHDAAADLLAASCAIELNRPAEAVAYGEAARAIEPENWKVGTTLVTAYAMAGKRRERDAERAALRALHASGTVPEAAQTSGFLLDEFVVKQYRVQAIEYFSPVGKFHIYYRFLLRKQNLRAGQIDVQSDDFNQASWAKANAAAAAEGQRQYQITGESSSGRVDYGSISGVLDYDTVRARIVEIVNAQAAPFPAEQ